MPSLLSCVIISTSLGRSGGSRRQILSVSSDQPRAASERFTWYIWFVENDFLAYVVVNGARRAHELKADLVVNAVRRSQVSVERRELSERRAWASFTVI